jgi:hypothetical protein
MMAFATVMFDAPLLIDTVGVDPDPTPRTKLPVM